MKVPHLSEQLGDIQGMIGTGYGWLYSSRFWLLTIRDGREDDARKWLSRLVQSGLVVSAADVRKSRESIRSRRLWRSRSAIRGSRS